MMHPDRVSAAILLAVATLATGCAGYRLGSMLPDDIRTVFVPTFVNRTSEPLIETETTRAAIEELQKDGSLKVVPEREADSILRVTIESFRLSPVAFRRDQRSTARDYRLTIVASVELVRRDTGAVIARNPAAEGEAVFQVLGDLSSSKLVALPLAAQDLAHDVVEKVVEAW